MPTTRDGLRERRAFRRDARDALVASGALLVGVLVVAACGTSTPHGHAHAHGMGHRFERADAWAPVFDDPARDAWQRPKDVVTAMEIEPGMTVADVGAGTGYFEPWLSRAVGETGRVIAADIEPDMVRYLTERAAREHLANVRPHLAAADDPRLPAGEVDRVLVVDTWHHVGERTAYATKLASALKVGGKVFVVDFKLDSKRGPPAEHKIAPAQVVRELGAGGIDARLSPIALPDQYVIIGMRR